MAEENNEQSEAEKVVDKELQKTPEKKMDIISEPIEKDPLAQTPEETQKAEDLISKANTAVIRQEDATKDLKEQLDRQERMSVQEKLGGRANAGSRVETTEEKEIKSTKEFLKGTGYEDILYPQKP